LEGRVDGRERKRSRERKGETASDKRRAPDKGEQRGKTSGILQGRIRNFWKLQGLICKARFPIDLKPE
jgi:hypothetical protein